MNKTEAAQILDVNATDSAAQVEARYLQVTAFLSADADSIGILKSLAEAAKGEFEEAYHAFEGSKNPTKQQVESVSSEDDKSSKSATLMSLIFPLPRDSAGEPLSNQWWKVYQRAVILFFLVTALCFDQAPRLLQQMQKPPERYIPPISTTPTQSPSSTNPPFGAVGPPPDSGILAPGPTVTPPIGLTQGNSLTPDPGLNPTPNANPLSITPTQSPLSFLIGLFWAINQGTDVQSMVKDPTKPAVATMLMRSHVLTPRLENVTDDKMKVISQLGGTATVRVNEVYFTGFNETNDYYLVSVNGVWKLSDIQPAAGGMR